MRKKYEFRLKEEVEVEVKVLKKKYQGKKFDFYLMVEKIHCTLLPEEELLLHHQDDLVDTFFSAKEILVMVARRRTYC